jgi:outer membrane protein assembly factor BamA
MLRCTSVLTGAWLSVLAPVVLLAQDVQPPVQPAPVVRSIKISGTKEISTRALQESLGVRVGEPLADSPEHLAQKIERQYHEEGYVFARASAVSR